jgi:sporulation protein YlmC with PRC-barrel domain
MNLYSIRRRNAWKNAKELETSASISARVGNEEMPDKVRWIRSYVVQEEDGTLGTVCIYQGNNFEAIREHAKRAGMPADEITQIGRTVVIREDPEQQSNAA